MRENALSLIAAYPSDWLGGVRRDVQRVVIVDPSDATREPLRNLLLGVESVWLEAECSRYEFFFDVVHQSKPDVAVIALDSDEAMRARARRLQEVRRVPHLPARAGTQRLHPRDDQVELVTESERRASQCR